MNRFQLFVVAAVLASFAAPPSVRAGLDEDISNAIDKGTEYLLKQIEGKQVVGDHQTGRIALETYALIVAGVSVDHPLMKKNFASLKKAPSNLGAGARATYTISCYAMALDAAISQIHADMQFMKGKLIPDGQSIGKTYRAQLEKSINAIIKMKHPGKGRWNYGIDKAGSRFDNSNVQFAVLALGLAPKRKIKIDPKVWEEIALHFIEGQQPKGGKVDGRIELVPREEWDEDSKDKITLVDKDEKKKRKKDIEEEKESKGKTVVVGKAVPEFGDEKIEVFSRGWSYVNDKGHGGYKWNMTCAGLSSLILANYNLEGKVPPDFQKKVNTSIRDGYGWMIQNFSVTAGGGGWTYYGIYSLEKVGDLGHVKKFGEHDWYDEVAKHVIKEQKEDGGWGGKDEAKRRENTAFALLVLNRATSLLTQRSNRMVVTGPGAHRADNADRDNWVYIQKHDRELHVPSVFRMVRLRPSARAMSFIGQIVDSYPPERSGVLVPRLVQLYETDSFKHNKRGAKYVLDNLESVTGVQYGTGAEYLAWYRRWKEADEVGHLVKKDGLQTLLKNYGEVGDSVPLRKKTIWALSRIRAKEAAPLFVRDLKHREEGVRAAAYDGLTVLPFSTPVPRFDATAKTKVRDSQAKNIEDWLALVNS